MKQILLIFLLYCTFSASAEVVQDTVKEGKKELKYATDPAPVPLEFDEEKIASYKNDAEFDYKRELTENWWTTFKRYVRLKWNSFLNWLFEDYDAGSFLLFFLKLLPYLVLLAVLIFAVWLFAKLNPAKVVLAGSQQGKVFLNEEEEIIQSEDIPKMIKKAVSEENFRMAIRYNFLFILQQLSEKDYVEYEFSKTDEDYLAEIKPENMVAQFRRLTRIYDFVWYGNLNATHEDYEKAEKDFSKMLRLISEKNE